MFNRRSSPRLIASTTLIASACLALLVGCGAGSAKTASDDGKLEIVVGFYPLQFVSQQIGGQHVSVTNLTKVGAEPHDLELAPRDVGTVTHADLVVYLKSFQPALDDAVAEGDPAKALDVSTAARLESVATHGISQTEAAEAGDGNDPHFWLDPTRLADVATVVAARLEKADPAHKAAYATNAAALQAKLGTLNDEYAAGLAHCTNPALVTSHAAFGYLAERYHLKQVSVSGLDPNNEPTPAQLAALTAFVRANKVSVIYTETLASPAVADTLASETGAKTAVLDPIEGLTSANSNQDYLSVMRSNLKTLQVGQGCR